MLLPAVLGAQPAPATAVRVAASGDVPTAPYLFVDNSCANNGNGAADACASSPGGSGRFNDLQSAFAAATAGYTVYIREGSGVYLRDDAGTGYRDDSGYHPTHSGTSGSPIVFRNYPGHRPVLQNCTTYVATECQGATITGAGHSWITIRGLTIIGAIHLHNSISGTPCTGCAVGWEIDSVDCSIGWFGDGNWSCLYLEAHTGAWVHHNYIHDLDVSANVTQAQGTGIKLYHVVSSTFEYNTHAGEGFEATGIDDKENGNNNVIRYNLVTDIAGAAYQLCFYAVTPYNVCDANQVYGNIAINAGNLVTVQGGSGAGSATDTDVYNNTGYNILVFGEQRSDGSVSTYNRWNNILVATEDNDYMYGTGAAGRPSVSDYNVWTSGQGFTLSNTGYANLAAVQSGLSLDTHSTTTACSFVNAPTDLHTTGACQTFGRVRSGGSFTGTPIEVGAYGVTSCVGAGCP